MKHGLRTLALVAQKGGVGKSTLAINLAVLAGQASIKVAIVDTDPQRTAADWWRSRKADWPTMIERPAADLAAVQAAARSDGFGLLVVDCRPSVEAETLAVVRAADLSLIPTRPATFDLRAIATTAQLITSTGRRGAIVLNQVPPPRGPDEPTLTAEARAVAVSLGLPVVPPTIAMRAAVSYATNDGRAVSEYEPTGRAAQELAALWYYLRKAYLDD